MTPDSCNSADIRHLIARLSGLSTPISDYCRIIQSAFGCSRRSFPAAMLDPPLPTRRRGDIRSPSQAARIAWCGRLPGPVRCNCVVVAGCDPGIPETTPVNCVGRMDHGPAALSGVHLATSKCVAHHSPQRSAPCPIHASGIASAVHAHQAAVQGADRWTRYASHSSASRFPRILPVSPGWTDNAATAGVVVLGTAG